jgi:hypothetical protein
VPSRRADAGRIARHRRSPRPTRSTDGGAPRSLSRCSPATGGGSGHRCGFGTADHRGSRRHRRDVSLTQTPRVLHGGVPRHRGERGQELPSPLPEGQPADATCPESGERRREAKGTIFALVYRRLVPRLGHAQAIGAIAHGSVARVGRFFTKACGTKNAVRQSAKQRRNHGRAR